MLVCYSPFPLTASMGYIYDISICRGEHRIVVKKVSPQAIGAQSFGDRRKAFSYQVEASFYEKFAATLIEKGLSIPTPFHVERGHGEEITICMSKLEGRPGDLGDNEEVREVLRWMATLHAATWGEKADIMVAGGLQPVGGYWHLDTRPDEHAAMPRRGWEGRLKRAARAIDARLKRDRMQCCVHGDAKEANMIWSTALNGGARVSMYDFQYCGKAPPTVDLAYFLCVAAGCGHDDDHVRFYHRELMERLPPDVERPSLSEFLDSLSLAFCDFQRFMSGWGNWGCDLSTEVTSVLDRLDGGKDLGSEDAYDEAVMREFG